MGAVRMTPARARELEVENRYRRLLDKPDLTDDDFLANYAERALEQKAADLQRRAASLAEKSLASLASIPPGQPIQSRRDRNALERATELMRKATELARQAEVAAGKVSLSPTRGGDDR